MSIDIDWEGFSSNSTITRNMRVFLDEQFNSISLPPYIDKLSVSDFSMGSTPPKIVIRHICTPFEEFYSQASKEDDQKDLPGNLLDDSVGMTSSGDEHDDENRSRLHTGIPVRKSFLHKTFDKHGESRERDVLKQLHNYNMNSLGLGLHEREVHRAYFSSSAIKLKNSIADEKSESEKSDDIQFVVEIDYCGDIMIEISVNLSVNYPSAHFISLPIKLKITDLEVHSLAAIAYIEQSLFASILCDLNSPAADYFSISSGESNARHTPANFQGGNFVDYATINNKERIDVIRSVKIDTEIGENENNVLRNVGKVEKFLVEQLRTIIRDELCWPGWICVNLFNEATPLDEES